MDCLHAGKDLDRRASRAARTVFLSVSVSVSLSLLYLRVRAVASTSDRYLDRSNTAVSLTVYPSSRSLPSMAAWVGRHVGSGLVGKGPGSEQGR